MSTWDKYDDGFMGGVDFTIDMMNPFTMPSLYKLYKEPSSLTVVQAAYWPTITTAGAYLASAMSPGNPYHWSMYRFILAEKYKMALQHARTISPRLGSIASHPAVLVPAATAAVTYQIHSGHRAIARSLPEHEQQGFWQFVGSAMGGTVGVGNHGLF